MGKDKKISIIKLLLKDCDIMIFDEPKDLFCVPMSTLGDSVYSSEEIESICNLGPTAKKDRMHNLYEAVQSFLISGFEYILDVNM